jgi:hypothetical protein
LYVDSDILRFSNIELAMKVVVSTMFDDPPHNLGYAHNPLVYDLLRHSLPL